MEQPIIEIKHIGKRYLISHERGGYVALRDVLMNVLRQPFSFLKSKAKQAAGISQKEDFWALRDINLSVMKGEVIGIVGNNGAGKSTLLKILSQITPPTEGEIILRGRVGSLLEVGTGFHPELTGRENIFLNGAILGMKRVEIARKFDAIVEFAGITKFLDTPVKYYSSGMYVRLAFSVAAHMEPDILIVDEVLAVGDAEFQKKCLGKMEEVTSKEGRTILFVSHNMAAIERLCQKVIVLEHGKVKWAGPTEEVIPKYLEYVPKERIIKEKDGEARIISCSLVNDSMQRIESIHTDESAGIKIDFEITDDTHDIFPNYSLATQDEVTVLHSISTLPRLGKGKHSMLCRIPADLLNNKKYHCKVALMSTTPRVDHAIAEFSFSVEEAARPKEFHGYNGEIHGVVRPKLEWISL